MTKRTCSEPGCTNPHLAQDRCGNHYQLARKAGVIQLLNKPRHSISNVNPVDKTGDCAICGPVDVKFSDRRPKPRCGNEARETGRRHRAKDKVTGRHLPYHRDYNRRKKFRLEKGGVERLIAEANDQCQICHTPVVWETARIDHDHACCSDKNAPTCGYCIRGILCQSCNTGIGLLGDSPARLMAAARYIDRNSRLPFGRTG